jgi:hypothetical protein
MKIYIAGRVTGLPYESVVIKFEKAEQLLLTCSHQPVSPIKHVVPAADPCEAMKICLPLLLDCDAILLLNDYPFSEGAQIEAQLARYAGKHIINEDDLT